MKKILTPEEKAAKRRKSYNPIMVARSALRRAFSRSPMVQDLMKENKRKVPRYKKDGSRHKIDGVEYLCNVCGKWKKSTKKLKVAVDHIIPVVDPVVGFIDMEVYFKRLFCDKSNLQVICGEDHNIKTNLERQLRKIHKSA